MNPNDAIQPYGPPPDPVFWEDVTSLAYADKMIADAEAAEAEEGKLLKIANAALALPDSLATFFYADDPVVPVIHRLWKALGRELPAVCFCSSCDPEAGR